MDYDFSKVEKKWQARWDDKKVFVAKEDKTKKKFYALVEFPAQLTPARQISAHPPLKISPVTIGPQMGHFMDENVLQKSRLHQTKLKIQPDTPGFRRA